MTVNFRVRHQLDGGHVRVRVFASEFGAGTTHGSNGELVFRPAEWEQFRKALQLSPYGPQHGGPTFEFIDSLAEQPEASQP